MHFILVFNTIEEAKAYKESILAKRETDPHRFLMRVKDGPLMAFMNTDWQESKPVAKQQNKPEKPKKIVFDYNKETSDTKLFIDILISNKLLGKRHNYSDKNIYEDDIPYITTLNNSISGYLNMETMILEKPKVIIKDLSCVEKLTALTDISGNENKNFFASYVTKINLPKTLKTIGNSAFAFCIALKEINIPKGVEKIESRAFFNCNTLNEIELPSSINELGNSIFGNSGITKIILNSQTPPKICDTTFKNLKNNFEIYVPKKAFKKYLVEWENLAEHIFPKEK